MLFLKYACLLVYGLAMLVLVLIIARGMKYRDKPMYAEFKLTEDDIDFLQDLQFEMLTQDHVGQAAPRFWVVEGTERVFCGTEYGTDGEILYRDVDECADGLDEAVEYFLNNYGAELEENDVVIEKDDVMGGYAVKHVVQHADGEELIAMENAWTIEELIDALEEYDVIGSSAYSSACYKLAPHIYPNTLFLTNRSCKSHIEWNHYHYSSDAHSYAMTAWRSPEVERLWSILDKIDWEAMRCNQYGAKVQPKCSKKQSK